MKLYFTIGTLILLSLALPPGMAQDPREEAAARWMVERQERDGSWGAEGMEVEDRAYLTSGAVVSLLDHAGGDSANDGPYSRAAESGARWLQDKEFEEVAGLSAGVFALERSYLRTGNVQSRGQREALLAGLLTAQNRDGGWGERKGAQSTPWHTAGAVTALLSVDISGEASSKGIEYLMTEQLSDGSWGHAPLSTAASVTALALAFAEGGDEKVLKAAIDGQGWLVENQGAGGKWFNAFTTGEGLTASRTMYTLLGSPEVERSIELAEAWLYGVQNPDGSWGMLLDEGGEGSVLATSGVLSALTMMPRVKPLEPRVSLELKLDNSTKEAGDELAVELKISNSGPVCLIPLELVLSLEKGERVEAVWRVPLKGALRMGEGITQDIKLQIPGRTSGSYNLTAALGYTAEWGGEARLYGHSSWAGIEVVPPPSETPDANLSFPAPMGSPEDPMNAPLLLLSALLLANLLFSPDIGGV